MPSKVYNNVVDHRLFDAGRLVEDVTKVGLPDIQHPTTEINAAGMTMAVDMPNITHIEAMEYNIVHNNGVNCYFLATPGKHVQEFRIARQRYDVAQAEIVHESVKYRLVGVHKGSQKGDVETGSPYGTTDTYSCIRYEEEINGIVTVLIDAMAGIIRYNGRDYSDDVQNLLK